MSAVNGLLTVLEVADQLRVSKMTVYRMIQDGTLPSVRVGKRGFRIPRQALADYVAANTTGTRA